MSKLRFAVVLPVIQLILAVVLFKIGNGVKLPKGWDTPYIPGASLVCVGLSAPAFPLIYLVPLLYRSWATVSILGLGLPQILFLPGVVAVWYLTGRTLDRWGRSLSSTRAHMTGRRVLIFVLSVLLGVSTLVTGFVEIRQGMLLRPETAALGYYAGGLLFLTWSLVLLICPLWLLGRSMKARVLH